MIKRLINWSDIKYIFHPEPLLGKIYNTRGRSRYCGCTPLPGLTERKINEPRQRGACCRLVSSPTKQNEASCSSNSSVQYGATFAVRVGTIDGVITHNLRAETRRDLAAWARAIVQGCHSAAHSLREYTIREYIVRLLLPLPSFFNLQSLMLPIILLDNYVILKRPLWLYFEIF